jgi:hypothetical protein
MNKCVTAVNALFRARRELKMARRVVILVMILFTTMVFISFFTAPPIYYFRIAYAFINLSLALVTISVSIY